MARAQRCRPWGPVSKQKLFFQIQVSAFDPKHFQKGSTHLLTGLRQVDFNVATAALVRVDPYLRSERTSMRAVMKEEEADRDQCTKQGEQEEKR